MKRFMQYYRPCTQRARAYRRLAFQLFEQRQLLSFNFEYNVELQTHEVGGVLIFDHLSILVTPQDQSSYHDSDNDGFADEDCLFQKRSDGTFGLSLGAGTGGFLGDTLVGDFNRAADIELHPGSQRYTLSKPAAYSSTRAWANDLITRTKRYPDNLEYDTFPEITPGVGYNSNSFIAGLLAANGTAVPNPATIFAGGDYPGWATPVPAANFPSSPLQQLDLIFTIDTTGSMSDDIDAAKASSVEIINQVKDNINVRDSRIAVVDYRDFPMDPYGAPGDYPFNDVQAFTCNKNAAVSGIQSLSLGNGLDWACTPMSQKAHCATQIS